MTNETNVAEVATPTSEKITALTLAYQTAWSEMLKHTNPLSKEAKDAKLAVLKIEGEMKAEEMAIAKAANDAKIAEARNARIALNTTQLSAYLALVNAPKNVTAEAKAALQSAFDTAREAVENELLAKFASSKPAKAATDGEAKSNGRDTESKAAILEMFHAGKSQKEIVDAGHARSTVWHTINNYKKANA